MSEELNTCVCCFEQVASRYQDISCCDHCYDSGQLRNWLDEHKDPIRQLKACLERPTQVHPGGQGFYQFRGALQKGLPNTGQAPSQPLDGDNAWHINKARRVRVFRKDGQLRGQVLGRDDLPDRPVICFDGLWLRYHGTTAVEKEDKN